MDRIDKYIWCEPQTKTVTIMNEQIVVVTIVTNCAMK